MKTLPPAQNKDGIVSPPEGGFPEGMVESSFDGTNWIIYFAGDKPPKEPTLTVEETAVVALGETKDQAPYYKQIVDAKTGEIVEKGDVVDPNPLDSVTLAPIISDATPVEDVPVDDGGGTVTP